MWRETGIKTRGNEFNKLEETFAKFLKNKELGESMLSFSIYVFSAILPRS